jgi:polysaccharide deacetylase 2 family uncharacterized protein YibQ
MIFKDSLVVRAMFIGGILLIAAISIFLWFRQKPMEQVRPVVRKEISGRITVVIDDWGYNKTHCKQLSQMPGPVGVAILPHLPYSKDIIACAAKAGHEPMLHLPLEPHRRKEMFHNGYVLKTDMDEKDLKQTLMKILNEMNGVVGVNNHQGSKGSESEALMTFVLQELKKRKLFFLDSRTSAKTKGTAAAEKLKMRIAVRDVFLDNRNERKAIEREFARGVALAKQNGYVLMIGHDRVLTLKIIAEQMKQLKEQGFEFISVAEYIRQNGVPKGMRQ